MKLQKSLVIGAALTVAVTLVGLVFAITSLSVTSHDQAVTIHTLASNSDALRDQVKDAGATPVAPAAKTITGDTGSPGDTGPRGFTGGEGDKGEKGDTGSTGIAGLLGAVGGPGANGLNGQDSSVPGPKGDAGDDGTDSTVQGPAGVSIADVACQDDGTWLITLTDSTTRTASGPCRVGIIPAPPTS